jgi:hypothetical protein
MKANLLEKTVVEHKEVGGALAWARSNPFVGIHAICLVEGNWTRWNILLWSSSREMHSAPKFHIDNMEL